MIYRQLACVYEFRRISNRGQFSHCCRDNSEVRRTLDADGTYLSEIPCVCIYIHIYICIFICIYLTRLIRTLSRMPRFSRNPAIIVPVRKFRSDCERRRSIRSHVHPAATLATGAKSRASFPHTIPRNFAGSEDFASGESHILHGLVPWLYERTITRRLERPGRIPETV